MTHGRVETPQNVHSLQLLYFFTTSLHYSALNGSNWYVLYSDVYCLIMVTHYYIGFDVCRLVGFLSWVLWWLECKRWRKGSSVSGLAASLVCIPFNVSCTCKQDSIVTLKLTTLFTVKKRENNTSIYQASSDLAHPSRPNKMTQILLGGINPIIWLGPVQSNPIWFSQPATWRWQCIVRLSHPAVGPANPEIRVNISFHRSMLCIVSYRLELSWQKWLVWSIQRPTVW
jgi:hypothetical protein